MTKQFTFCHVLAAGLALLPALPVAAQPASVPPPIAQTHADCARPQYASDMLVCGDPELTAIDAEVAGLAAAPPVLADGAIWEDQAAWVRRRSQCAFNADHRGCLVAAYADRKAVLIAAAAPATVPMQCTGAWQHRAVTGNSIAPGQPVTLRDNGQLLGVATVANAAWQPALGWRAAGHKVKLKTQDGRQFVCRPASY